jgi:hypothetical protein
MLNICDYTNAASVSDPDPEYVLTQELAAKSSGD